MITLKIENITSKYAKKSAKFNSNIALRKYQKNFGLYDGYIDNELPAYKFLFAITVQCNDGFIQKIKFGYKDNYDFDHAPDIIGGRLQDSAVNEAIYNFCNVYGKDLFDGVDILELVKNDEMNFLNYQGANENKTLKRINNKLR
ncbi:MAG: hypothetical protein IJI22_05440 [Bacilli bacterium]|nr:hypothetical protein [Bacilli bacterium]